MKKKFDHFIPVIDGDRSFWMVNFKEKIAVHGPVLGLDAATVTEAEAICLDGISILSNIEVKKRELEMAVNAKAVFGKDGLKRLRMIINTIKNSKNYLPTIGGDLGVIGSVFLIDTNTLRPVLKLSMVPGAVQIHFTKKGMPGVTFYSRPKGTHGWEMLAHETTSPYLDTRPLADAVVPETREYMATYYNGKADVGQQSDAALAVFGG